MSSDMEVERPTTLSLDSTRQKSRVSFSEASLATASGNPFSFPTTSTRKFRFDPDFRPRRKRSYSFTTGGDGRYGPKRRKYNIILPTKFLLGGNITDPLNLGALGDEESPDESTAKQESKVKGESVRGNEEIQVIIPPNINDPLNLDICSDSEDKLAYAINRQRKRRRYRKKKRRNSEPGGMCASHGVTSFSLCSTSRSESEDGGLNRTTSQTPRPVKAASLSSITTASDEKTVSGALDPVLNATVTKSTPSANALKLTFASTACALKQCTPNYKRSKSNPDKIVSPVIPQPGGERKRHLTHSRSVDGQRQIQRDLQPPKKYNPKNELFQYGNYNQYYGYRNPDQMLDPRVDCFQIAWFENKKVLDIGCNIGHITLTVARDFAPCTVVGIDIDKKLVGIAKKNIRHYLGQGRSDEADFPKSFRLLYGPLKPPVTEEGFPKFPFNVNFHHANYVLESDELLETVHPEYDTILCLSITKWIHLNWGDAGLRRFFKRIYLNLHPGGILILEPQSWASYKKKRKLTMKIFENYKNMKLFPENFQSYLLKDIGFMSYEKVNVTHHISRGFQRPLYIFTKGPVEKCGSTTASHPVRENPKEHSCKCGLPMEQIVNIVQCDLEGGGEIEICEGGAVVISEQTEEAADPVSGFDSKQQHLLQGDALHSISCQLPPFVQDGVSVLPSAVNSISEVDSVTEGTSGCVCLETRQMPVVNCSLCVPEATFRLQAESVHESLSSISKLIDRCSVTMNDGACTYGSSAHVISHSLHTCSSDTVAVDTKADSEKCEISSYLVDHSVSSGDAAVQECNIWQCTDVAEDRLPQPTESVAGKRTLSDSVDPTEDPGVEPQEQNPTKQFKGD